ncbi:MAG: S49 family peptidase, partial [Phenylobacterium sp.]|nr:S49 family peptidase [Phenylobacterium sp.]
SDTASEQIRRAVEAAKAAGKPVVVSMGPYAASGGYWISSNASAIVAQPTTLTGSIGVFGGKIALGEALARVGVDLRQVGVGADYASAFSLGSGLTESQRAAFGRWMDQIYARFIGRVSEGRRLPVERVESLAKGRVWTGAQARELGLVDQIGGFYDAVDRARALSGVNQEMRLKWMASEGSPFEAFERLFGVSAASARTLAASAWVLVLTQGLRRRRRCAPPPPWPGRWRGRPWTGAGSRRRRSGRCEDSRYRCRPRAPGCRQRR